MNVSEDDFLVWALLGDEDPVVLHGAVHLLAGEGESLPDLAPQSLRDAGPDEGDQLPGPGPARRPVLKDLSPAGQLRLRALLADPAT